VSSPAKIPRSVDLPDPDGPTIARLSDSIMLKFISDRMFSVPPGDWTDLLRLEAIIIKFSNNAKISGA
jgi:hypothetical protein